jgi:SAM-dependent methyltransferase
VREQENSRGVGHAGDFIYSGSELQAMRTAENYYRWIVGRFTPYLSGTVVEVGAGLGTFSKRVLELSSVAQLIAIEPDRSAYQTLLATFTGNPRFEARLGYLEEQRLPAADSLIAVNVLEHVHNDRAFLGNTARVVRPGGYLLVFTPAVPAIFGSLDSSFGHHRRYTRSSLTERISGAGWKILTIRYSNLPGILAWFLLGRIFNSATVQTWQIRAYDRLVIPWLSRIEGVISPPLGQSLLAIAQRE